MFHFDPAAERKLRLKIDLMIVPTVALLYLFCFIHRANIGAWCPEMLVLSSALTFTGNARLAGLEKDLNLQGYGMTIVRGF